VKCLHDDSCLPPNAESRIGYANFVPQR